jgi:hypothetical protein
VHPNRQNRWSRYACRVLFAARHLAGDLAPRSPSRIPNWIIDERGVVVARAYPDSKANFKFANLPLGKYRVTLPGFAATAELIEITSSNQPVTKLT